MTTFDEALTNCSAEPIHIPGATQPFGMLFALDDDLTIRQCSANAPRAFGVDAAEVLGQPIGVLLPACDFQPLIQAGDFAVETPLSVEIAQQSWNAFLHRHRGQLILELEHVVDGAPRFSPALNFALRSAMSAVEASRSLLELCERTCDGIRRLTSLDGVMVYRFHEDEHGEVIAESKADGFPKYLGLHYPASDIPRQARALFLTNWVRMIPDRDYTPVPLLASDDASPLDLGRSLLRSVSPIHIEYLRNMGVRASLTISLIQDGKLWGLIAGHQYHGPRHLPFEVRAACETIGRLTSSQLAYKAELETQAHLGRARTIHKELVAQMEREPELLDGLLKGPHSVLDLVHCAGVAVAAANGAWRTLGRTPSTAQIERMAAWLSEQHAQAPLFRTDSLAAEHGEAVEYKDVACGVLAIRIPKGEDNYILWFRPEVIQSVTWAGDPEKPVTREADRMQLHPRKSFEGWRETVRLRSLPWNSWEIGAAGELRNAILAVDLQRQFQRELEARAAAEWANEQKEQLLWTVSHDLKNPLHSLMLNVALIERSLPAESVRKAGGVLSAMRRSLERMNHLISDLLAIAKLESGTITLDIKRHSAAELLRDVCELLQPIAMEKNVQLELQPDRPEDCIVLCDRERLLQVLSNLVGNAVKFTPEHGFVRLSAEPRAGDTCFAVSDTGPGIPKENLTSIFDRFWQARQTQRHGTGLGLSIAKGIVEAHGGRIWAESEPGEGSTFRFTLPVRPAGSR